jgi:beta-galactosidase
MGLINWARVVRPFSSSIPEDAANPLVIRLQENPDGFLLFVLNHGRTNEKTTIRLNVPKKGNYVLQELLHKRNMKLTDQQNVLEFSTGNIGEKEAEIWNIKRLEK